jgi:DNA-directed RNA polymerase subunit RPC12/RpoP
MNAVADIAQLEAAIGEAELTDEEAELVRRLVKDEELAPDEAVAAALATREAEPPLAVKPAGETEGDEPSPKQLRDLVKENERHVKQVGTIMGGFVEGFEPCEKCDTLGLQPPGPRPRAHSFYKACETCAGYGQVLTGSLEAQYASIACPDCGGRGFLEAMIDNTPAAELVKQLRAQRAAGVGAGELQPQPVQPAGGGAEVTYGRPTWMGDPQLGA